MKLQRLFTAAVLLGVPLASSVPAQTADPSETIKTLSQRIEDLEQRIRILDRKRELDQEAAAEKAKTATPSMKLDRLSRIDPFQL